MTNAGELRLESASFSHDGGRDYNEDAVGESDAFGAVRLFMLDDLREKEMGAIVDAYMTDPAFAQCRADEALWDVTVADGLEP